MRDQVDMISVIVPVYNVRNYLEKCIWSICSQTYRKLEIILVDDGSTDGSGTLCDEYALQDSRIRVYHQENGGLSAARNQGIKISNGKYISLIDSDDFVEKHYIETLYETAVKTDSDIVCGHFFPFYDGKEEKPEKYWEKLNIKNIKYKTYSPEQLVEAALYQTVSVTAAQLKLYKKKCFEKIHFPEGRYYEDLATTYLFFQNANQISVLEDALYGYRIRKNSIMRNRFSERNLDCLWVSQKLVHDISISAPQQKSAAYCAAFRINRLVYPKIPFHHIGKRKVWDRIKQYRMVVWKDDKAQKYERILALSSYGGQYFFTVVLGIFGAAYRVKNETESLRKNVRRKKEH